MMAVLVTLTRKKQAPSHSRMAGLRALWGDRVAPIRWRVLGWVALAVLAYGGYKGLTSFGTMVAMVGRSPCGCLGSGE